MFYTPPTGKNINGDRCVRPRIDVKESVCQPITAYNAYLTSGKTPYYQIEVLTSIIHIISTKERLADNYYIELL